MQMWDCLLCQPLSFLPCSSSYHLAASPLHCGCLSLLLSHPVWMNVSSLIPSLSDFHTVQFSGSSAYFILICCCPSFGCARRQSISTYASIFARSPLSIFNIIGKYFNNDSKIIKMQNCISLVQTMWKKEIIIHWRKYIWVVIALCCLRITILLFNIIHIFQTLYWSMAENFPNVISFPVSKFLGSWSSSN